MCWALNTKLLSPKMLERRDYSTLLLLLSLAVICFRHIMRVSDGDTLEPLKNEPILNELSFE